VQVGAVGLTLEANVFSVVMENFIVEVYEVVKSNPLVWNQV